MTLAPGARLGPYEIVAPLGAGGMGEVYRARDTRLSREVAIKLLPASVANDPDWLRRFEQEARAAGTLNHPNLITIHELGTDNGTPYIAMELLEGETLRSKLEEQGKGARISLRKAIDYSTQIAHGLAAAHDKGIVHRDLKPDNIFVTRDGRVKILDFGLAKLSVPRESLLTKAETEARRTAPGTVLGTVGYMSPEQVRGGQVDHRTDVFALGAILYEMLSGKRAFHGNSAADTMSAILHEDPPELSGSNPNVSPGIDRIIRHCLEKNAEERFQSARDIAFDLETMSGLSGSSSALFSRTTVVPKQWIGIAAAVAIGVVLGAAAMALLKRASARTAVPRTLTQLTFQSGVERYASLSPDGKTFLFVSEASGKSDIYLQRVDGRNAINLTKDSPAADVQPAFSPDGERIAFRSDRDGGGIFVMGATGESVRRLTSFGYNPAWSPDGSEVVFSNQSIDLTPGDRAGAGGLWVVNVRTGEARVLTKHDAVQPSWSPHGDRIAFWGLVGGGGQRDIWTIAAYAANPDKTILPVTNDPPLDWNPFWSSDGKYLYFGSDRDGTMNLWRIRIDEKSGRTEGAPEPVNLPTRYAGHFSAARMTNAIAFSSVSSTDSIERYALDPANASFSGSPSVILSGSIPIFSFGISPDGKQIVFSNEGKQEDLFLLNSNGSDLRQITNDVEKDRGPSWSRDGKRIYFYSNRGEGYEIWSVRPDGSALEQVTSDAAVRPPSFPTMSPDGARLLSFNAAGSYIWRFDRKRFESLPRVDAQHVLMWSSWSPDGRSVVGLSARANDVANNDGVVIYSFQRSRFESISDESSSFFVSPVWLPDGKRVIYAHKDGLKVVDLATKQRHSVTPPIPGLRWCAISPDGRSLYVSASRTDANIWLMSTRERR